MRSKHILPMEDKDLQNSHTLSQDDLPQRKSVKVTYDSQIPDLPVNGDHLGTCSVLSAPVLECEEDKTIWVRKHQQIETFIEPHSTSNPEEELTTYCDAFSSGESELEDLLYHFNNFFTNRFERELSQYQANLSGILYEQQNHVRRIVSAVTDDCSQGCPDSSGIPTDEAMHGHDANTPAQEPMMTNQNSHKYLYSNSISADRELTKKQRLLQLLTMSCSVSSVLAKPQFRS